MTQNDLFEGIELLSRVEPLQGAAPYLGGKRNLAQRLVTLIQATPHKLYAEPFVGMGGIFFKRTARPKVEVINDYSRDVANFFRILQRHLKPFLEEMEWMVYSRSEFERLKSVDPSGLTDLERAARFYFLQRSSFGGCVGNRSFGVDRDGGGRFNIYSFKESLNDLHKRLSKVIIENLSYSDFITKYNCPGTLFYLDPPYWGNENDYGKNLFSRTDFEQLAEQLQSVEGHFILSLNDCEGVRETFKMFDMTSVETVYTVSAQGSQTVKEVIITGGKNLV
ncbi:MAG: DNA adenine methylase [Alphaproteobacteria bacterium]|nr:DNA adenine methylase [Alphaproteobacteria bacterium]MDD9919795.1 DNA adenine methylase [Alphaproteobacteria bacterium]